MVRNATDGDVEAITRIYNYYIVETVVTFEETVIPSTDMASRIHQIQERFPWLVFVDRDAILGFAYAGPWNTRCSYRQSMESTIYLEKSAAGKGVGTALYSELLRRLIDMNAHAIVGGIALPNEASVALHEKLGFQKVAHFKEVGYKMGRWIDVGYWELLIDHLT